MSLPSAANFLARVKRDSALRARLRKLTPGDMEGMLKVAAELGFALFTREEFIEAAKQLGGAWRQWTELTHDQAIEEGELSDADLERIAGGTEDVGINAHGNWNTENSCNCGNSPVDQSRECVTIKCYRP